MELQTITQRNLFERYFRQFFQKNNTFVKSQTGNVEVNYLGYFKGIAALHFPITLNNPHYCILFSRLYENIGVASMNFFSQKDRDILLFSPQKFQIITKPRAGERHSLGINNQSIVLMNSVMTENVIHESLSNKKDRVRAITETIEFQKKDNFNYMKLFFLHYDKNDLRMKFFKRGNSILAIDNIHQKPVAYENSIKSFYLNNIYKRDSELKNREELVSEVSVPLLYNRSLPFGYIQVNSSSRLTKSHMSIIQRMAILAQDMTRELKLFSDVTQRFLLSDVSQRGFSVVFKDKRFVKIFKENDLVFSELQFYGKKKAHLLSSVRHIDLLSNGNIKIGFMLMNSDETSKAVYNNFLNSVNAMEK